MSTESPENGAARLFGLSINEDSTLFTTGKIQSSVRLDTREGSFVLQEINQDIFYDVRSVAANARSVITAMAEANLPRLEIRPARDGSLLAHDDGRVWRCYKFVAGDTPAAITTSEEAQVTARAFGRYDAAIAHLKLSEHIIGYHDFDSRVGSFEKAVHANEAGRAGAADATIADAFQLIDRLRLSGAYDAWKAAPIRNVHNDAKGPNCVVGPDGSRTIIDLDTTMPGFLLADVGELVRSCTRALIRPAFADVMAQIEAVNRGFLAGYGSELSRAERAAILLAGPLMTAENGVRFLGDHLRGDVYYGAAWPNQNLERAIEMFALAQFQIAAIEDAGMQAT